jgi:hypothetical protein
LHSINHKKCIKNTFEGEIEVTILKKQGTNDCMQMENRRSKFMILTLDLPNLPLFKEQQELGTLP